MRKRRPKSGMWDYLDAAGVLEKGSDEEIKAAKRAYRKQYFLLYKQRQRANKPEFTVSLSKNTGDYQTISNAAKRHKMPVTTFLRAASLSYLRQTYLVPDRYQIARLEQYLSDCLNEIKSIASVKERFFWQRDEKLTSIEKRISKLEMQINEALKNPPLVSTNDHQNQIA